MASEAKIITIITVYAAVRRAILNPTRMPKKEAEVREYKRRTKGLLALPIASTKTTTRALILSR